MTLSRTTRLKISLAVLVGVCCLGAAERISWRFWSSRSQFERDFPVQVYRKATPYTVFTGERNGKLPYLEERLNCNGYRGKPATARRPGEYRIFVLGGSTVLTGVPPFTQTLEKTLWSHGFTNVSIYNYGVVSSVSGMELVRIATEVSDKEPDLVIMYNGANDFLHPTYADPRPGYPFNFVVIEKNPILESDPRTYPRLALMAYGSNILRAFFSDWFARQFTDRESLRKQEGWLTDPWRQRIADVYMSNIRKAKAISGAFGAEFLAFYQPTLYTKEKVTEEERPFLDEMGTIQCKKAKLMVTEIAASRKMNNYFFDVSSCFDGVSEQCYIDAVHLNKTGNRLVAKALCGYLTNTVSRFKTASSDSGPATLQSAMK